MGVVETLDKPEECPIIIIDSIERDGNEKDYIQSSDLVIHGVLAY